MVTGTYLSIITLNVNGLNAPTKRHRLAEWIQKQDPTICCLQETHFKYKGTERLEVKGWKIYSTLTLSKRRVECLYSLKIKHRLEQGTLLEDRGSFLRGSSTMDKGTNSSRGQKNPKCLSN